MQSTFERLKRILSNANPVQRIAIGAGVVAIVASALLLVTSGGKSVQMSPLYTDLSEGDAASVVSELDSRAIEYELKDGGATVMVPKDDVYRTRLYLSEKGLPKNNDGYALLDKQGITTSEFRTRTAYQRALEGEIARTIGEIEGIEMAVVHLALPPQSSFVDDAGNPTASVLVRTGKTLSESQISSIVYLVSSSVRDMSPENVTVADANGVMLHAPGSAGLAAASGSGKEAEFEASLSASISQLVSRVAGPGKAAVQVNVSLNMDQRKSVSETFTKPEGSGDGNTGLIDGETSANEEYNGVSPNQSSVLGPDGAPVAGNNQNATTDYTKDNAQRDYVYDRVVEEVNAAPGEIERLSVAVAVDDQAVDAATVEQIEGLVVAAAGIDEKRGDQVVVTRMPFAQADDELAQAQKEAAAQESQGQLFALIRTALVALALALMAFFAYRSVKKARTVVVENIDIASLNLGGANQASQEDEQEQEQDETQERLTSMAQMQPEAVAQVLKTWLSDPRR